MPVAITKPRAVNDSMIIDPERLHFAHLSSKTFEFGHRLAHHPLFSLQSIREVARRIPKYKGFVYWQNGSVDVDDNWDTKRAEQLSLDETLAGMAHNNSLVILKHAEQDPIIGPTLQALLAEVVEIASQEASSDITIGESLIFINSPRRKTSYHFDLESTHLLQVSGEKLMFVFDQNDRTLVRHEERERHCAGNHSSAIYDPARQSEAAQYDMQPGVGVHIPPMAPHWVQNGDSVSISINLNFELKSVHHRLRPLYRFNRRLRKFGLSPTPPGQVRQIDDVKLVLDVTETKLRGMARTLVKGHKPANLYPVWTPSHAATFETAMKPQNES